eukprot:64541_1
MSTTSNKISVHYLNSLLSLNDKDQNKILKVLCKIFKNIIDHPNNDKYKEINLIRMKRKLNNHADTIIDILLNTGFYTNFENNRQRLLFDMNYLDQIHNLYKQLLEISLDNVVSTQKTPDNSATSSRNQTHNDINTIISLQKYDENMVAIALAASNNDIQIALQYLQENSY